MAFIIAEADIKSSEFSIVVTRADGTVEDLGTVAYWHQNPLKRWAWQLKQWYKLNKQSKTSK